MASTVITIPYKPREWCKELHSLKKRWNVLVCHRRSGKTTATINHLIRDAMLTNNSRYAYVAPYFRMAKQIVWDMLKYYSRPIPSVQFNEAELRADYPNGSRIQLFGADNPDSLRGLGFWGVVLDEYSQMPSSIFTEVIRPALVDHEGYAIFIGTPKGRNSFYDIYSKNKDNPDWYVELLKASESGIVPQEELDDARKNMSLDEYNQEFECSFTASIKGAYYADQLQICRQEGRITSVPPQQTPVLTFWDLGMSDYTCIIFAQKIGREIHIIDYYEGNNMALEDYALELRRRPYNYEAHYLPHDIKVRELGTGKSRIEILGQHLGRDTIKVVRNIPVKDGIEAVRMMFSRLWFDEVKASKLLDALGSYTQEWDDRRGMFRDQPLHNFASHASDSARMLAVGLQDEIVAQSKPIPYRKQIGIKSKYSMSFTS